MRELNHAILLGLIGILALLSILGAFKFSIWSQISAIGNMPLSQIDVYNVPHHLRYSLIKLFVHLPADLISLSRNTAYKIVLLGLILVIARNMLELFDVLDPSDRTKPKHLEAKTLLPIGIVFLATQMNGRLIFNFAGQGIIVLALTRFLVKKTRKPSIQWPLLYIGTGLWLTSVSTGTFMVGFGTIALTAFLAIISPKTTSYKKWLIGLFTASLTVFIYPLLKMYLLKNINYYGGGAMGFVNMFAHGMGKVFLSDYAPIFLAIVLCSSVIFAALLLSIAREKPWIPIFANITGSVVLGVYGWSTLFSMIPSVLVVLGCCVVYLLSEWRSKKWVEFSSISDN